VEGRGRDKGMGTGRAKVWIKVRVRVVGDLGESKVRGKISDRLR
jgi:hypothetical protein